MRTTSVYCTCILLLCTLILPAVAFVSVSPSGTFLDDSGSTLLFHGVNAVPKLYPFLPTEDFDPLYSLGALDMQLLQGWGMNVIRLGVMWQAVETAPGVYNTTYLNEIETLIARLGEHGIYTLVDAHQDLLHPTLCGEGFPQFYVNTSGTACNASLFDDLFHLLGVCRDMSEFNLTYDSQNGGWPTKQSCLERPFIAYYPSSSVSNAFNNFYTNVNGVLDAFVNYWELLASTFANNPHVIGYDLLNEPWPGDIWSPSNGLLDIVPGYTDRHLLQPLYARVAAAIRAFDTNHIVFYEPTPFPDTLPLFNGIVSAVGFESTPGGPQWNDKQAMSYHIYCCASGADVCDQGGDPLPQQDANCDKFTPNFMQLRQKDVKRLGGGIFLSEFGGCTSSDQCVKEIARTVNSADENLQSWSYWQYKYFNDVTTTSDWREGFFFPNSTLMTQKVSTLCRVYAQATQGNLLKMNFNTENNQFFMQYQSGPQNATQTTIYFNPQWHYPNGAQVEVQPSNMLTWQLSNFTITFQHAATLQPGTLVSITLTAN